MKTIIKALKLQLSEQRIQIEKRKETHQTRSAHWKRTFKAETYSNITKEIATQAAELDAVIEKLEETL